ncbi:MAG TPA: glutamine synthetase family protein [Burkholderiales bacterium]|nr:glutamine synthetase family protein [Burkholderiales bacterium]HXJ09592.1 glutamine synthetase family protein [Burkholderiales bacterium]
MKGLLKVTELRDLVGKGEIETVVAGFTDHYGRLLGKRFDAQMFIDDVVKAGGHACDYLLTVDMEMEPVPGYKFASWELGYGDFHLVPDLGTLRLASWLHKTALVLCDIEGASVAPRSILRRQIEQSGKTGFECFAATELEHYLFRTSYRDAARQNFLGLEPAGWYLEDYHILQGTRTEDFHGAVRRHLRDSGVPVETSKGEWGRGQHEVNLRYASALEMADRHTVFKQCLKEVADAMGISVTFMAKFAADGAGSSCHIHLSLWRGGKNAFAGRSDTFRWFLGGWIAHVPEVMPFYAPTINSYKRFVDASWAPTRLAWSDDNRTAGFRVIGEGESLRIECRIPGADANPYLALAASLASGLDGITNKTEPPECFTGDVYAAKNLPRVPYTLAEANNLFSKSQFAKKAFGEDVVEHYAHFFRTEVAAYDKAVTDWELKRYFERI